MDTFFEMIKPKDIKPRMHYGGIVQNIKKLLFALLKPIFLNVSYFQESLKKLMLIQLKKS